MGRAAMIASGDSPIVARLLLGSRLKQMREAAGISGQRAGAKLRATGSKISRVESGLVPVRRNDVADLVRLYKLADPDMREELLLLADQSQGQGWWDDFTDTTPPQIRRSLELEAAASLLIIYDPLAVPAILQTRIYAETACGHGGSWRAGLRPHELTRRRELLESPAAPRIWALLDETALRRPGARLMQVMRAQVDWLAQLAASDNVSIQIVPTGQAEPWGASPPFVLTRFGPKDLGDRILLEGLTGITELARRADVDTYRHLISQISAIVPDPFASRRILHDIGQDLAASA